MLFFDEQLEMLRNIAERNEENSNGTSSGEESDDRVTNSSTKSDANVMLENYSQEMNVPFYDNVAYFGERSDFLEIEEKLCSVNDWEGMTCSLEPDLQQWWEF